MRHIFNVFAVCFFILHPAFAVFSSAEVHRHPSRIVSINLCADELLLRVADPVQIVAVTSFPRSPEAEKILGRNSDIRTIRGRAEEVLSLKPDLVLVGPFTQRETVSMIKQAGIFVFSVGVPRNFEEIYQNITALARAVGRENEGRAIIAKMKTELASLGGGVGRDTDSGKRALFFQSEGISPGKNTFEHAIFSAAGLVDLGERMGIEEYGRVSLETLVREKPDMLVLMSDQKNQPSVRGEILNHPAIREAIPGVETVVLPSCLLNCGSPSSIEAVKILKKSAKSQ
jgi:iron complex transport system substrate-binding protein